MADFYAGAICFWGPGCTIRDDTNHNGTLSSLSTGALYLALDVRDDDCPPRRAHGRLDPATTRTTTGPFVLLRPFVSRRTAMVRGATFLGICTLLSTHRKNMALCLAGQDRLRRCIV